MRRTPGRLDGAPTVLLVEDEPDVRESIQDVLQASLGNVRILAVASGEAALPILAAEHVDVVVSDYKLPGMDGLHLLREARRAAPHAPRFLITAFAELEVPEETLDAARLEAVVTKPLEVEDLVARIRAALRKSTLPAAFSAL